MAKGISLFNYRWHIDFFSICNNENPVDVVLPEIINIRVKPSSKLDVFPRLMEKQELRPIFRKIKLDFRRGKDQYLAVWFMDELKQKQLFSRIFGVHHNTPVTVIGKICCDSKCYKWALYRQGLKEPVEIPESAYQLIVFKNKFEDYRSDNYNQPRGAWAW